MAGRAGSGRAERAASASSPPGAVQFDQRELRRLPRRRRGQRRSQRLDRLGDCRPEGRALWEKEDLTHRREQARSERGSLLHRSGRIGRVVT